MLLSRALLAPALILGACAIAKEPPREVLSSCLAARVTSSDIAAEELATSQVTADDDFSPGVKATYLISAGETEVGYGQSENSHVLIYGEHVLRLSSASLAAGTTVSPRPFDPFRADWIQLRRSGRTYLCVSFNFDGVGRSGKHQDVRAAYLLTPGRSTRHRPMLHFTVGPVAQPSTGQGPHRPHQGK